MAFRSVVQLLSCLIKTSFNVLGANFEQVPGMLFNPNIIKAIQQAAKARYFLLDFGYRNFRKAMIVIR